jgi:hypothetical protein
MVGVAAITGECQGASSINWLNPELEKTVNRSALSLLQGGVSGPSDPRRGEDAEVD